MAVAAAVRPKAAAMVAVVVVARPRAATVRPMMARAADDGRRR